MQDFRNLSVWHASHGVTLAVYRATSGFPSDERFGLTSQTRRAAVSIAANIAEGCGRQTDADFAKFLHYAMGSASELECHLLLARDLGFMETDAAEALLVQLAVARRMLNRLIQRTATPRAKSQ